METLALIGLAIAGLSYSSSNEDLGIDNTQKILDESYNSDNRNQVEKIKETKASESTQNKQIINTLRNPDSFENQFNSLSYDRVGIPSANNQTYNTATGIDAGLKRALELKGEYSEVDGYDMGYGVVSQENFTHNNMVPFTNRRDVSMNLNRDTRRLENHTGGDIFWKRKEEVPTLFEPMKDLTYVNGMPNFTNKMVGRYIPSMYKQNEELPGSRQQIGPGINGVNQDGLYNRTRILPKTIDDLRAGNDQKVTYEGRVVKSGIKGIKRQGDVNLTTFKVPDFREQQFGDLVGNSASVKQRTIYGQYQEPNTNRTDSLSYAGIAALETVGTGNYKDRTNFTESNKTTHTFGVSNAGKETLGTYAQNCDTARQTIKETTLAEYGGNSSYETAGTYTKNFDNARQTIKETTLAEYGGNSAYENGVYAKNFDNARQTIKETTLANYEGNSAYENGVYAKNFDNARQTIKETTLANYEGNANFINGTYLNNGQQANMTIRQTTENNNYIGTAELNNGSYQRIDGDKAKQTIKETTLESYNGNSGYENGIYAKNLDNARTTIKETTLLTNYNGTANHYTKNNMSQDASRNMCIDERREILTYNRSANGGADISGPNKSTYGQYRNTKEGHELDRTSHAHRPYNLASGTVDMTYTRVGRQLESRNSINPYVQQTLNKNPYINNIVYGVSN